MRALSVAATGMSAQQTQVDVIANNIANVNTTGFKRSRAEFTDLLYQTDRVAGVPTRGGNSAVPEGTSVGLGVRTVAVRSLHMQGSLIKTANRFDIAINGQGWFQVAGSDGETFYSRSGAFSPDANGQLVTLDGLALQPAITVPQGATEVMVSDTGQVSVRVGNATELTPVGQLTLAYFPNNAGLAPMGQNMFRETPASGTPTVGVPGDPSIGTLKQGYLEGSNVDPVKEITELIASQRAYEMNSKVIQAADDMYGTVSKGLR